MKASVRSVPLLWPGATLAPAPGAAEPEHRRARGRGARHQNADGEVFRVSMFLTIPHVFNVSIF